MWGVDGYRVEEEDSDGRAIEAVPPLPVTEGRKPVISHVYHYDQ